MVVDPLKSKTLLFCDRRCALLHQRQAAEAVAAQEESAALLGLRFCSWADLLAQEWSIWGDGRGLVTPLARQALIYDMLDAFGFHRSRGTAEAIASWIERCAGSSSSVLTSRIPAFDVHQQRLMALMEAYLSSLEERGLIEPLRAAAQIIEQLSALSLEVATPPLADDALASFLMAALHLSFEGEREEEDTHPCPESFFLLPAGASTSIPMIFKAVRDYAKDHAAGEVQMLLCSPDPQSAFSVMASPLGREGIEVLVGYTSPFHASGIGRACIALVHLLEGSSSWLTSATDFAKSIYSQLDPEALSLVLARSSQSAGPSCVLADRLNRAWRSDRTVTGAQAVQDLSCASATFDLFRSVFDGHLERWEALYEVLLSCVHGKVASSLEKERELAALSCLDAYIDEMASLALDRSAMREFLSTLRFSVSLRSCADTPSGRCGATLRILPIRSALSLVEGSFDLVVLQDVSESVFSAHDPVDPLAALAESLGAPPRGKGLDEMRWLFERIVRAARDRIVFCFPQRSEGQDRAYPSFCFDEYVQVLFGGKLRGGDLGKPPESLGLDEEILEQLRCHMSSASEQEIEEGIGGMLLEPCGSFDIPAVCRAELRYGKLSDALAHAQGNPALPLLISPSSIEAYLRCPYAWFLDRILKVTPLDEGFGPLETGLFAHGVLERFYGRLHELYGVCRADQVPRKDVSDLFDAVFDELLALQRQLPPGSGRYVPLTELEAEMTAKLKESLLTAIFVQSALPPSFVKMERELIIGDGSSSPSLVSYAGFALTGKVDRIDIDEENGRFYILDYKGSISGYDAGERCFDRKEDGTIDPASLPPHIQTLIYASALLPKMAKEGMAFACVGSFYTSYRAVSPHKLIVGSWAADAPELAALSDRGSKVLGDFGTFLQEVEQAVAVRLEGIPASKIPPCKELSSRQCEGCLYRGCEARA